METGDQEPVDDLRPNDPRVGITSIYENVRSSVFPAMVRDLLAQHGRLLTTARIKANIRASDVTERIRELKTDADLRHFLLERASVHEALRLDQACAWFLTHMVALNPDSDEFRNLSGMFLTFPTALYICQTGLRLIAANEPGNTFP